MQIAFCFCTGLSSRAADPAEAVQLMLWDNLICKGDHVWCLANQVRKLPICSVAQHAKRHHHHHHHYMLSSKALRPT